MLGTLRDKNLMRMRWVTGKPPLMSYIQIFILIHLELIL